MTSITYMLNIFEEIDVIKEKYIVLNSNAENNLLGNYENFSSVKLRARKKKCETRQKFISENCFFKFMLTVNG